METIQSNQSIVETQFTVFDAIIDLLSLKPVMLAGILVICILLALKFKKDNGIPKVRTMLLSLLNYYYLCILFIKVVGIPTVREFIRMFQLGESFFNPNMNLVPFSDGFSISFILNIFLFIPLGFLCPLLSNTYKRPRNVILLGTGLSLFVEMVQLFTLYRATDINDLLTNVFGTAIGYLGVRLLMRLMPGKLSLHQQVSQQDKFKYWPVTIIAIAFACGFIS